MAQTLRKTFSYQAHSPIKSFVQRSFQPPLSVEALLIELREYLQIAQQDLLQPRQACIDRILREALA